MLKTLFMLTVVTLGIMAFAVLIGGAALYFFTGLAPEADSDPLDGEVSDAPAVAFPRPGAPALAVPPARDPVLGTDVYTADRHARLGAFQQRPTPNGQARRGGY